MHRQNAMFAVSQGKIMLDSKDQPCVIGVSGGDIWPKTVQEMGREMRLWSQPSTQIPFK